MSFVEVNFVCPECGADLVSAVLKVTEYVEIKSFCMEGRNRVAEIGDTLDNHADNSPFNFECHACGNHIGETEREAYEWLSARSMLREQA